jgi:hypothetical protein
LDSFIFWLTGTKLYWMIQKINTMT